MVYGVRLKGKTAIITGSSRGIGRGIARVFAREGANLVLNSRSATNKQMDDLLSEMKNLGSEVIYVQGDVSNSETENRVLKETLQRFGRVDILVNNAGIGGARTIVDTTPELWDRMIQVDLSSVYYFCRRVIPEMIRQGGGKIVNISSVYSQFGSPHVAAYCAAKAAVSSLTRQMAVDYSSMNININAIMVGFIETEMTRRKWEDKEMMGDLRKMIPANRSGAPEDIGYAALYLCSDEASYVCGQNLIVDGGWSIAMMA